MDLRVVKVDLVLEGGGVKGIGLVGAISVLEERGYSFARIAGTSGGAIVGALVAAGYSTDELNQLMQAMDWTRFRDGSWLDHLGVPGKAISLLAEEGIYEGKYLTSWLGKLLADRGIAHFADLRTEDPDSALPPDQRYRLVVMTADVSHGELRRLPWDYPRYGLDPDRVRVVEAVRASMSIPFFYAPVKLKDRATNSDAWLVDGGMLSNFPVDVFDRRDGQPPRWPTLGIRLTMGSEALLGIRNEVHNIESLARALLSTMVGSHDQLRLDDPGVLARTISVDTMSVRPTDFDIDRQTQVSLYENGRKAATDFLDGVDGRPGWDGQAGAASSQEVGS
jgi:NTE family protein